MRLRRLYKDFFGVKAIACSTMFHQIFSKILSLILEFFSLQSLIPSLKVYKMFLGRMQKHPGKDVEPSRTSNTELFPRKAKVF